jgi:uncharacterized membrane protein
LPAATRLERGGTAAALGVVAALYATLGLLRWSTFHNRTFDLAFYVRMAWGLARNDFWDPFVDAHVYGLHLSPVLVPLGLLGHVGTGLIAPTAIVLQGLALAFAAWPLATLGADRPFGRWTAIAVWCLYPNLAHVAGYEFHVGSLAVLPLSWMAWALVTGHSRALVLATVATLLCREDFALVTAMAGVAYLLRHGRDAGAFAVTAGSVAYALWFFLVLHPAYAPAEGSMQLHFAHLGDGFLDIVTSPFTRPEALLAHLGTPTRLAYLPAVLLPLAFLPLARPWLLLPTLPTFAISLLSAWPTATDLDVHYLTPALPFLVAAALDAPLRLPRYGAAALLLVPTLVAHVLWGGTPLSIAFDAPSFQRRAEHAAIVELLDRVPPDASVQAPDALLPHLAERRSPYRGPPPDRNADYTLLDLGHRLRFAHSENLLRTSEEPRVRDWLARPDSEVLAYAAPYVLLRQNGDPREGLGAVRALSGRADPAAGIHLAACLRVLGAELRPPDLVLTFVAAGPCPNDLALRLGTAWRAPRVDLLFDGLLNPVHLRAGDRAVSTHRLTPREVGDIRARGLRLGVLRSSGARPHPDDPMSAAVPLSPAP